MSSNGYLLDTHALVFWQDKIEVSQACIDFIDGHAEQGNVYVSSISFLEMGLLAQKERLRFKDVRGWKNELLANTNVKIIDADADVLINSTELPQHHKDPFDRVLIAQAQQYNLTLVTRDREIKAYRVDQTWIP